MLLVGAAVMLSACSATKSGSSNAPGVTTTSSGVQVTTAFGTTPTVTVPSRSAPTALTQQATTQGTGTVLAKGDTLIANYVGQTWTPKSGKPDVFDSSFSRGAPAAFVVGEGQIMPGWDSALVGKNLGSRMVLTIPPADGYGSTGNASAGITATDTLVFVIDLIADYKPGAAAPGTVVPNPPTTGLPTFTNVPGKQPTITSTAGVPVPAALTSRLLVAGSGAKIDTTKTLVLELVQTDLATATKTQSTWAQAPQTIPAQNVFSVAADLTGQNIGSRALVLAPATPEVPATSTTADQPAVPPTVLIIDVVGQF